MKNRWKNVCALALVCAQTSVGVAQQLVTRDARYTLRPGDVITVDYRYTPEYNATASVEPDGFVSLPMLGTVKVGGLTLPQAHDALLAKAGDRLNEPELNVGLKEFEKPYYVVGGEVGAPGRFELHGRVTALQAVEIAGGIKTSGKASQVLLIRPVDGERGQTRLIDLKKVTAKRQLDEDVEVRPGDILIVPKTRLAKVEPFVRLANAGFYVNPFNL
jgi:polysaccharide export outer membrane protein